MQPNNKTNCGKPNKTNKIPNTNQHFSNNQQKTQLRETQQTQQKRKYQKSQHFSNLLWGYPARHSFQKFWDFGDLGDFGDSFFFGGGFLQVFWVCVAVCVDFLISPCFDGIPRDQPSIHPPSHPFTPIHPPTTHHSPTNHPPLTTPYFCWGSRKSRGFQQWGAPITAIRR